MTDEQKQQIAEVLRDAIFRSCKICRGTGSERYRQWATYETDSPEEHAAAWSTRACTACKQQRDVTIALLARQETMTRLEGEPFKQERDSLRAELAAATADCRKANTAIEKVYDALDTWSEWDGEAHTVVAHIIDEHQQLRAKVETLTEDKERLDCLDNSFQRIGSIEPPGAFPDKRWVFWEDGTGDPLTTGYTFRAAVDSFRAALKEGK